MPSRLKGKGVKKNLVSVNAAETQQMWDGVCHMVLTEFKYFTFAKVAASL